MIRHIIILMILAKLLGKNIPMTIPTATKNAANPITRRICFSPDFALGLYICYFVKKMSVPLLRVIVRFCFVQNINNILFCKFFLLWSFDAVDRIRNHIQNLCNRILILDIY